MPTFTTKEIRELRELSGAGMMRCKQALEEAQGSVTDAAAALRREGLVRAEKLAQRETRQGCIGSYVHHNGRLAALVEVNCETDFVAKNDSFRAFTDDIARKIATNPGVDLEEDRIEAFQKLKENIVIRRSERVEVTDAGAVAAYIHTGGKVGVLVEVGANKDETTTTEAFKQLVRDITLQIAAANPISVDRTAVPAAVVEREREVCRGQVPPGKPANIVEKIVDGKMDKFYSGVCLVDQAFIKNPDQTIAQLIAAKSKELGDELVIRRFLRYSVGEQIGA